MREASRFIVSAGRNRVDFGEKDVVNCFFFVELDNRLASFILSTCFLAVSLNLFLNCAVKFLVVLLRSILVTCICDFLGGDFAMTFFLVKSIVVLLIIAV